MFSLSFQGPLSDAERPRKEDRHADGSVPTTIVAIDAIAYERGGHGQFTLKHMLRDLIKA